jgi:hypothetical protein
MFDETPEWRSLCDIRPWKMTDCGSDPFPRSQTTAELVLQLLDGTSAREVMEKAMWDGANKLKAN